MNIVFPKGNQIPGTNAMGRWGLGLARLGSFVGKYSFSPKGTKSQAGPNAMDRWGIDSARLGSFVGKYSFPLKGSKFQGWK